MQSAIVVFTDTPELFGGEIRPVGVIDFKGGKIARWTAATGEVANVSPWPVSSYGRRPTDFRYHYNWFSPIAFSKQKPYALYAGSQVLSRSLDRGETWTVISPDLSGVTPGPLASTLNAPEAECICPDAQLRLKFSNSRANSARKWGSGEIQPGSVSVDTYGNALCCHAFLEVVALA